MLLQGDVTGGCLAKQPHSARFFINTWQAFEGSNARFILLALIHFIDTLFFPAFNFGRLVWYITQSAFRQISSSLSAVIMTY
ncbi:hypothetical protein A8C56_15060 [Niabella ginsenosidivorans]|uniref:Uncharacterized protein n=1 Tax=Niabella ginsenosidivorans TaxID=1176587 RepID=A0A1A9I475_9BACT|nr:hypothetical protein A8C56_15060 [Niabella ginsenosidivorans]